MAAVDEEEGHASVIPMASVLDVVATKWLLFVMAAPVVAEPDVVEAYEVAVPYVY